MKILYRSQTNKVVFGVFGGLGEYYNNDPVLFRLAWATITVFTGVLPGLITYVLALLIVPKRP